MKEVVEELIRNKKTISTMESCTGGFIANEITNIEGSSEILKFSAVTYSNEYKIKMGVSKEILEKYTVYSMETAKEMSHVISSYTNSNYGIGVTGKLNRVDEENPYGEDNIVFINIFDKDNNKDISFTIEAIKSSRKENKKLVCDTIINQLLECLK